MKRKKRRAYEIHTHRTAALMINVIIANSSELNEHCAHISRSTIAISAVHRFLVGCFFCCCFVHFYLLDVSYKRLQSNCKILENSLRHLVNERINDDNNIQALKLCV